MLGYCEGGGLLVHPEYDVAIHEFCHDFSLTPNLVNVGQIDYPIDHDHTTKSNIFPWAPTVTPITIRTHHLNPMYICRVLKLCRFTCWLLLASLADGYVFTHSLASTWADSWAYCTRGC
jgi:hypothetical protein